MKASVYSLEGKIVREIELPEVFEEKLRPDLIRRAVLSEESKLRQPKGNYRFAGFETSARYVGRKDDFGTVKNRGIPHLPHEVRPKGQLGKVKRVPLAVKGHRAHPPKPEKKIFEEMNKKEYVKALRSAIAMTAAREVVARRTCGRISPALPIIIESTFEELKKTRDSYEIFKALNLDQIIERAKKNGTKGPLVVVSSPETAKGAENLPGVDVVSVDRLKVRHLAPGTHPGRLAIYTEKAIEKIAEIFGK
ncbi:MAG: 50S ribosomal protein L4 [Candidatus Bilamarchaeaceae archaeon]